MSPTRRVSSSQPPLNFEHPYLDTKVKKPQKRELGLIDLFVFKMFGCFTPDDLPPPNPDATVYQAGGKSSSSSITVTSTGTANTANVPPMPTMSVPPHSQATHARVPPTPSAHPSSTVPNPNPNLNANHLHNHLHNHSHNPIPPTASVPSAAPSSSSVPRPTSAPAAPVRTPTDATDPSSSAIPASSAADPAALQSASKSASQSSSSTSSSSASSSSTSHSSTTPAGGGGDVDTGVESTAASGAMPPLPPGRGDACRESDSMGSTRSLPLPLKRPSAALPGRRRLSRAEARARQSAWPDKVPEPSRVAVERTQFVEQRVEEKKREAERRLREERLRAAQKAAAESSMLLEDHNPKLKDKTELKTPPRPPQHERVVRSPRNERLFPFDREVQPNQRPAVAAPESAREEAGNGPGTGLAGRVSRLSAMFEQQ